MEHAVGQDLGSAIGRGALPLPEGWFITGSKPQDYDVGLDAHARCRSNAAAVIRSRRRPDGPDDPTPGFATLMQSIEAGGYRGHRVRLRATLRTESVVDAATLWFRVDGQPKRILGFDNLEERRDGGRLHGTNDWTERRIVLDVPQAAESLHFGFLLRGSGTVWAARFEPRTADAEDGPTAQRRFLPNATNLDFSQRASAAS